MDSTKRFSVRVADYVKFRPSYPSELLADLESIDALTPPSAVVDVGYGTGLLTRLFLEAGYPVMGVEPNPDMRAAGENFLGRFRNFHSVAGAAEATTLPTATFDLVVAGQAFHWFDRAKARAEFRRILRPPAWVALIWNERDLRASAFQAGYEELVRKWATDYAAVDHRRMTDAVIGEFFGAGGYRLFRHGNEQRVDLEGLRGRWNSSSYAPRAGEGGHAEALAGLEELFAQHAEGGRVRFAYETKMYVGALGDE